MKRYFSLVKQLNFIKLTRVTLDSEVSIYIKVLKNVGGAQ